MKRLLKLLGFQPLPTHGGSHEKFGMVARGQVRRVTVDCPKAPFSRDLIRSMASQAGLSVREFYDAAGGRIPARWP
ncbi:MAG TPA: type II toxin-antitoxin system HicA family toxin [Rhodanobacteraceae bacterium]|nr:type II toxin-antitoxin system HicA family toxin [Rhodanobacteraceae bacterium]